MPDQTLIENNPLLADDDLPLFDRIKPEHVVPAVRHVLANATQQLNELEASLEPTWVGLCEPLERMDVPFERVWGPIGHLLGVKNSDELRAAHEQVRDEVVDFGLRASQSQAIYNGLKQLKESDQWATLNEARRRIIDEKLLSAELSGIGLAGEERERFNAIAQEQSKLSMDFSNNVLDAVKAYSLIISDPNDVVGMPPSLKQLAAQSFNQHRAEGAEESTPDAGPWRFTLDAPVYGPFMQHCRSRALREELYRAFVTRASDGEHDNTPLIPQILRLRQEHAKLLGRANFAEVSLARKMAGRVSAVEEMFETMRAASWSAAKQDLNDIEQLARESGQVDELQHWDTAFWAERLRENRFSFTDEELRPYFPLERVLDGLFSLLNRIFGVTVEAADGETPVWHPQARFFRLRNETGTPIASFFLDPYSRPADKRGGAWMDICRGRRRVDGQLQLPVAYLICNGTPPVDGKPSLMTFREVETLFHEFGHGLQHMLTTVDDADAAGISGVEWDAVELPSQFMENWCYHKPTLMGMTAHFETGAPLPDDLFDKICAARTYRAGTMMLRQLFFGMTDMALHSRHDPSGRETAFDVMKQVSEKTYVTPLLPEDRTICGFNHIFAGGYAAGYYSYKWAEMLSADAFGAFEEAGLDDESAVA
ncbi:MAG: M3 family metallopeptidase, partial [Planctomycetota bacterium]|nr:M3 family metallopeptidase [Planctomycetota bacterium]